MTTFIWTVLLLLGIETAAKIVCLAADKLPQRTKGSTAVDVVIAVGFIVWGAVVLVGVA